MARPRYGLLFGTGASRVERTLEGLAMVALFGGTFLAYAFDLFTVSGGIVVLPWDATVLGGVAAALIGYRRGGLRSAWLVLFASYLGFRADWAFLGLSSHSLGGKFAFLFDPVGLAVLGVATLVIGTVGFAVGYLGRSSIERLRGKVVSQQSHE